MTDIRITPRSVSAGSRLRTYFAQRRQPWRQISDDVLREVLICISQNRKKPVWWLGMDDFGYKSLPSLGNRTAGGLSHVFRRAGNGSFAGGREKILTRLGIPRPTFEAEVEYFSSLPAGVRFPHWQEVSDGFIRHVLHAISQDRRKPVWWLATDDFYPAPLPSLGNRTAGGLSHVFLMAGNGSFVSGREKILTRLGIPRPTLEEEVQYFSSLPAGVGFPHWQEVSDDFLVFVLAVAAIELQEPMREINGRRLRRPFTLLEGKKLGGIVDLCRDAERKNFKAGRDALIKRLLRDGKYQVNHPSILLSLTFPPHPDLLRIARAGR